MYIRSNLIRASQGVVVEEVVHLGVPAIEGITIVPAHPHYINAYRTSIDPDAKVLTAEQVAAELTAAIERGTAHVQAFRHELSDANKAVKRQLDHLDQIASQEVSAATDLKADADLIAAAKRESAQVAGWRLDTAAPEYVAARAIAGRVDCDDLASVATSGLRKAVESFEKSLSGVEKAQGHARRQLEVFADIEQKLSDPAREGAAHDLRQAMHIQQRVEALAGQLDTVRRDLRGQLNALDGLAGELQQLRQGATQ